MKNWNSIIAAFGFILFALHRPTFANLQTAQNPDTLTPLLEQEVGKTYSQSRIELMGPIRWIKGSNPENISSVSILEDDARGNVHFIARSGGSISEGWVSFAAWTSARVAVRRIPPFEKLAPELFALQQVNVATGQAREFRGLILSQKMNLSKLESIQTIIEGQFLVTPAVRAIPDIKRGEPVRVHLLSGALTLTTQGVAEEPGYVSKSVRVMTQKGKRQLIGMLREDGIVEVKL